MIVHNTDCQIPRPYKTHTGPSLHYKVATHRTQPALTGRRIIDILRQMRLTLRY